MMPHGFCYLWNRSLIAVHLLSDLGIVVAYYWISLLLIRLNRDGLFDPISGRLLPYGFSVFIFACGTTHLMNMLTIWRAWYWLEGQVKAFTAIVSLGTAVLLSIGARRETLRLAGRLIRDLRVRKKA